MLFDADLDHLIGLPDTIAHVSFYDIQSIGLSGRHVGNLLLVSGLEAEPALRLNQVWFQVAPSAAVTVCIGKFTAAQEFMASKTANLFINSTFGWPDNFATDLPSGGPSYPLAAPGVRVAVKPDDRTTVRAAAFAGDPAGPGGGDPQQREKHGLNTFRFSGRPFIAGEVSRTSAGKTPSLVLTLDGWAHLDRFAALHNPAVTPGPVAAPLGRDADYAVYGVADGRLWRSTVDSKRVVRSFLRLSYGPSDRNVFDLYADAGVTLSGPVRRARRGQAGARRRGRAHLAAAALGGASAALVGRARDRAARVRGRRRTQLPGRGRRPAQAPAQRPVRRPPRGRRARDPDPGRRVPSALVLGLRSSVSF